MPDGTSLDDVEIVASGPRFVLGVSPGGWGVWDRRRPETPVALFASTDQGMDQAERIYERLDREDRTSRGVWTRPLLAVMFVSLAIWLVARAVAAILLSMVYGGRSFTTSGLVRFAQVVDVSSGFFFAVWIAALVVFMALWLQRNRLAIDRLTAPAEAPPADTPPDTPPEAPAEIAPAPDSTNPWSRAAADPT